MEPIVKVEEVCRMAAGLKMHRKEVHTFLNFHHKLGDLLYFGDGGVPDNSCQTAQRGISDSVILSPQWLGNEFR